MEQLYAFKTGNAIVTRCHNTCFAIKSSDGEYFMVDMRGGNGALRILEDMNVDTERIHHISLIREHTDHPFGIAQLIRMIFVPMKKELYGGNLYIYCHEDLVEIMTTVCRLTLQPRFLKVIGDTIHLVTVKDGETGQILNRSVTLSGIHSTKVKQFGFAMTSRQGRRLICAGDEPHNPLCEKFVAGNNQLFHEAFYLYGDRERLNPYEKHHSIVKNAYQLMEGLRIPSLVLQHTEDKSLNIRKKAYMTGGTQYYHSSLFIPYDGETLEL